MSIYDTYSDTAAGTKAQAPRDPVPAEGLYPRCAFLEATDFTKDLKQFYKIRYEVLDGPAKGSFITQFKTLKGCPDEKPTALDQPPQFKFPLNPGQLSMGAKAMAEIKQAVGAAFGLSVEQANDKANGVDGKAIRLAATESQPCRGRIVALQVTYERYVKKDYPRRGQLKGKPGEPYVVISAFPVLEDGKPAEIGLPAYVPQSFQKKDAAPAAPPPPPAVSSGLPEGWKINPNAPDWAYNTNNAAEPQRKVVSF